MASCSLKTLLTRRLSLCVRTYSRKASGSGGRYSPVPEAMTCKLPASLCSAVARRGRGRWEGNDTPFQLERLLQILQLCVPPGQRGRGVYHPGGDQLLFYSRRTFKLAAVF